MRRASIGSRRAQALAIDFDGGVERRPVLGVLGLEPCCARGWARPAPPIRGARIAQSDLRSTSMDRPTHPSTASLGMTSSRMCATPASIDLGMCKDCGGVRAHDPPLPIGLGPVALPVLAHVSPAVPVWQPFAPVGNQNPAITADLRFQAAGSYSI